ncbi:peptide chain release factor N(5)-glutamine methyltransferase [uncultured Williamsia sp.]|uniref:peptide chain release factor N(5)-glutamine methyltransferase n=1 Tax=uncultured Williamsia sp. TaxID=259311 RepID=UPI002607D767|nr:peptide chain release factor N(5)-glutamine methyltransferase [uncultured Williamsia sp.]
MTARVRDVIASATRQLAEAGVESPRVDAEHLVAHALRTDRGRLVVVDEMTDTQHAAVTDLVSRRADREPLQHILGDAAFGPLTLAVGPGVFVPRPETELLLEWAVQACTAAAPSPRVVDLCSGSGALALGVAALTDATVVAVEKDDDALTWLRRNVAATPESRLRRVDVRHGDATTLDWRRDSDGAVDVVVSNPPYVPTTVDVPPEVADHDPAIAVFGGRDGMSVITPMAAVVAAILAPGGRCAIEHDDTTADRVTAALDGTDAFDEITSHTDLSGRPRFVTARRRSDAAARMRQ